MENLARTDPEVAEAIRNETERQGRQLEMIASENFVSEAVLEALGTVLTNKPATITNPRTTDQQIVRATLTTVNNAWKLLTDSQRDRVLDEIFGYAIG